MEILNEEKQHSWLLGNFRSCDVAPWSLRVGHVTCHVTLVTTGSLRNVAHAYVGTHSFCCFIDICHCQQYCVV